MKENRAQKSSKEKIVIQINYKYKKWSIIFTDS